MADNPGGVSAAGQQLAPSQGDSTSSSQLSLPPTDREVNAISTMAKSSPSIVPNLASERKPILCCDKLKICGTPPFNPFGHPERKLHFLCTHWSGRMAEPDNNRYDGIHGLDPYQFWGVICVVDIAAVKQHTIRWYAPFCNTNPLGGSNGLGGAEGRFMEVKDSKAEKMLLEGYLVKGQQILKYSGCVNHPEKKFLACWFRMLMEPGGSCRQGNINGS